jgi:hypothetical protein
MSYFHKLFGQYVLLKPARKFLLALSHLLLLFTIRIFLVGKCYGDAGACSSDLSNTIGIFGSFSSAIEGTGHLPTHKTPDCKKMHRHCLHCDILHAPPYAPFL